MKRIHLIEWGIIAIGLIFGYKFFESIFSTIIQIVYDYGDEYLSGILLKTVFIAVIYAAIFVILIRNSYTIAKTLTGSIQGDTLPFKIGKRGLLQIVLLALCFYSILSNITQVIFYIYESFKKEVGQGAIRFEDGPGLVRSYQFQVAVAQVFLALIVLFFSRDIVNWFIRKNEADELILDSETENKPDVHQ